MSKPRIPATRVLLCAAAVVAFAMPAWSAPGARLYFTDFTTGTIQRSNVDGSDRQTVLATPSEGDVNHVAIDPTDGRLFWTEYLPNAVFRANADGSGITPLVSGPGAGTAFDIEVDPVGQKVYWGDQVMIRRANYDGSNVEQISTTGNWRCVALDLPSGRMVIGDYGGNVSIANLDGSGVIPVKTGLGPCTGIEIDSSVGRIYYSTAVSIERFNTAGGSYALLHTDNTGVIHDLTLDLVAGKIYWVDYFNKRIRRMNLAGGTPEDVITNGPQALGIDVINFDCGNGSVEAGEDCDDGNTAGGDCCTADCSFETAGSPCAGDGNPCSVDSCQDGTCTHVAEPLPDASCLVAAKTKILIGDSSDPTKDKVIWRWKKGEAFDQSVLGTPLDDTSYTLCLYDTASAAPSLVDSIAIAPSATLWKSKGSKGFGYKDPDGSSGGVTKAVLKPGVAGKTSASVAARGVNLSIAPQGPDFYFNQSPEVTVQLVNSAGQCWTSTFGVDDTKVNRATGFKAGTK